MNTHNHYYNDYSSMNQDLELLCYKVSKWDYQQWKDFCSNSDEFQRIKNKSDLKTQLFPVFMGEVFARLLRSDDIEYCFDTADSYSQKLENWKEECENWENDLESSFLTEEKYIEIFGQKPEKPEKKKPKNEIQWALGLHRQIEETDEFIDLIIAISSEYSHMKKWILAGTGALKFGEICAEKLPMPPRPLIDPQKLRERILELREDLKEAIEDEDEEKQEEIQEEIEKQTLRGKKEILEYERYSKMLKQQSSQVQNVLIDALKQAKDEVEAVKDLMDMQGWGSGSGDESEGGSIDDKLKNAKTLLRSAKLRKIIKEAGRIKNLMEAKRKSRIPLQTTITGVKTGNDLMNLLPVEYGKFAHTKTRRLFIKDYSERNLLEFEKHSIQKAHSGPVIVLIDNSGSMAGENEVWSKALGMAYLMMCQKEKRDFYAVHYDEYPQREYEFKKGVFKTDELNNFISFFSGEGTEWEPVLNRAIQLIEKSEIYKNADIILITDGICNITNNWLEEWKQKRNQLKFTAYGILIGSSNKQSLHFMDKVIAIPSVQDDNAVVDIF